MSDTLIVDGWREIRSDEDFEAMGTGVDVSVNRPIATAVWVRETWTPHCIGAVWSTGGAGCVGGFATILILADGPSLEFIRIAEYDAAATAMQAIEALLQQRQVGDENGKTAGGPDMKAISLWQPWAEFRCQRFQAVRNPVLVDKVSGPVGNPRWKDRRRHQHSGLHFRQRHCIRQTLSGRL